MKSTNFLTIAAVSFIMVGFLTFIGCNSNKSIENKSTNDTLVVDSVSVGDTVVVDSVK